MFTLPYDASRGRQEGDYAQFKYGELDIPIPINASSPQTDYPLSNDPAVAVTIPLSLDTIEAAPNANHRFSYRICDVSNYCSEWSNVYTLTDVNLGPAPTDLLALDILHAVPGDSLINRADALLEGGLVALIKAYTNPQRSTPTDTFRVTLTSSFGVVTLPDRLLNNSNFPVPVTATPADLATLYGNATGNVPVTATWEIIRGTATYPAPVPTLFNLDLSTVGPIPIDGTDTNPGLLPIVVNAVRGPGLLGPDNILERQDFNRPAVARVPQWTVANLHNHCRS